MSTTNSRNFDRTTGSPVDPTTVPPLVRTMPVRMTTLGAPTNVAPLSSEELQLADRVSRRLHEQIRAFLGSLPPDSRNASSLSRFLGIDRTTCQRLVFTAARPYPGLILIDRLPGVRGMRQLCEAAQSAKPPVDTEILASFDIAIDRFDEAIQSLGGSQSALVRRISVTPLASSKPVGQDSGEPHAARVRLFEAAAEITGRYSETWVAVYVYQPSSTGSVREIEVARAHGLVGHVARRDAVPLTFHNFISKRSDSTSEQSPQGFRNLREGATLGNSPDSILREFSSDPLPVVNSRQPGEYLVQAIDTDPSAAGRSVDLMLATRNAMPHPASQPPRIEEVWAMINFPVRYMVFDVYLHRDLARECIPALDAHLWRPDFAAQIGDRWQTRFADGPRLELLGQGIQNAASATYSRHAELTRFLFENLKLDDSRFIGYRCALPYPVWRTGYCMSFDFNTSDE